MRSRADLLHRLKGSMSLSLEMVLLKKDWFEGGNLWNRRKKRRNRKE